VKAACPRNTSPATGQHRLRWVAAFLPAIRR
jgi:hypothetical protein